MRDSNDLLHDADRLRERFDQDGYVYLGNVIDPEKVAEVRRQVLAVLAAHGWVRDGAVRKLGLAQVPAKREEDEDFLRVYDDVQKLEGVHTLAHDPSLVAVMRGVVGETAFPHPLKIARLSFPDHFESSTPPHQDYPNNQGTPGLTAAWIPLHACPMDMGGLAVLRGSHRYGALPLATHLGPGNRQAVLPVGMLEELRWVATDYAPGDVLIFGSMTVHASLHNATEFSMRLSVDYRYQREGEPLADSVLHPHFQRLTWEDIYAGWSSDQYQYYWKDLDYDVVPFERDADAAGELDRNDPHFIEDVKAFVAYERKRDARFERRMARLEALLDPERARSMITPGGGNRRG